MGTTQLALSGTIRYSSKFSAYIKIERPARYVFHAILMRIDVFTRRLALHILSWQLAKYWFSLPSGIANLISRFLENISFLRRGDEAIKS